NDPFSDRLPRWSPDGKEIIFLSNRSGRFDLWSIHPDGSGLRKLTKGGSIPDCWAPDGTLIGYPDHGKPVALDPPEPTASSWGLPAGFLPLAWSPGYGAVVGRIPSDGLGHRALYIYTPGTGDFWKIASNAAFPSTVWLHDGFHLLFSQHEGIYVANLRQHSIHFLMPFPAGNMCYRFTISRDEHTLFFVLSDDREDIWMGQQKH
ncbi:MAG: TolB family protein, partial [Terriglobia bacterium]